MEVVCKALFEWQSKMHKAINDFGKDSRGRRRKMGTLSKLFGDYIEEEVPKSDFSDDDFFVTGSRLFGAHGATRRAVDGPQAFEPPLRW